MTRIPLLYLRRGPAVLRAEDGQDIFGGSLFACYGLILFNSQIRKFQQEKKNYPN